MDAENLFVKKKDEFFFTYLYFTNNQRYNEDEKRHKDN